MHNIAAPVAQHFFTTIPFVVALAGVTLSINKQAEDSWLEVHSTHSDKDREHALSVMDAQGLELMQEWENPSEEMSNGSTRTYLAERYAA